MPRTNNQARRNSTLFEKSTMVSNNECTTNPAAKSQQLFKHQLLNSCSFHEYAHGLFGIDARLPAHSQEKTSEDLEIGGEQLLLDCAKELMALKSHEGTISFSQMVQPHQRKRARFLSFGHLLEEISNAIEELASYSENGEDTITKNGLYIILEKDLKASSDAGKNNWAGYQEADHVAAEVEKQIISWLIMEVAMDLVGLM